MPYRDAVRRVSIAQLRAQFTPRRFRTLDRVSLAVEGQETFVSVVTEVGTGQVNGPRRWLVCPRCMRRVNVVGLVEGVGWACRGCGRWRSRNAPRPGHSSS